MVLKVKNLFLNEINIYIILISILIIYPWLFIWQCGDISDLGFFLTTYKFFFENLQEGQTFSVVFLSDLIGGIFSRIFPNSGVLGYKILYIPFLYATICTIYKTLIPYVQNKNLLLLGMICGVVFGTRCDIFTFYYDNLSFLLLITIAYLTIKAINSEIKSFLILSGIFSILAVLSRFPNILVIPLIFLFLITEIYYINKDIYSSHLSTMKKFFSLYSLGLIIGTVLIYVSLEFFGIREIFWNNLTIKNYHSDSSHSIINLLKLYINDFIEFIPHFSAILSIFFLIISLETLNCNKKIKSSIIILIIIAGIFTYFNISTYLDYSYDNKIKYLTPAFFLVPIAFSFFKKDKFSSLSVLSIFISIVQVSGTDSGIFLKLFHGAMILIPLSILIIHEYNNKLYIGNLSISTKSIIKIGLSFILLLSLILRLGYIYHVDSGIRCRFRATYSMQTSLMKGIFTTSERAHYIDKITDIILRNSDNNTSLFIYGIQPLFYFLTNQKPLISHTFILLKVWPSPQLLINSLEESIKKNKKWPLIVDTKTTAMGENGKLAFKEFLTKNNYQKILEEDNFCIYKRVL